MVPQYDINLDLHKFPKISTRLIIYRNVFKKNCSQALLQTHIYTDVSNREGRVGMAIICDETTIQ